MAGNGGTQVETKPPRFVAVGAGRMGRGIAIAFAYAGHRIALVDLRTRTAEAWQRLHDEVHAEIRGSLEGLAALGALQPDRIDAIAARVSLVDAANAPAAIAAAEMLFEGVPETIDAKREAFAAINAHCRHDAIVTSTTSSILVTELAALVRRPEGFLNMHWLNPAYVIPVVELSVHPGTAPGVVASAKATMESIGKLPVVCGATPGYIVPRLQALVMNEAARMVEEGAATAEEIDKATRYGMGLRFAAPPVRDYMGKRPGTAGQQKIAIPADAKIDATVGIGQIPQGFGIEVQMSIHLPGIERATAQALVNKAHEVCPYSNATRGNIEVTLTLA